MCRSILDSYQDQIITLPFSFLKLVTKPNYTIMKLIYLVFEHKVFAVNFCDHFMSVVNILLQTTSPVFTNPNIQESLPELLNEILCGALFEDKSLKSTQLVSICHQNICQWVGNRIL